MPVGLLAEFEVVVIVVSFVSEPLKMDCLVAVHANLEHHQSVLSNPSSLFDFVPEFRLVSSFKRGSCGFFKVVVRILRVVLSTRFVVVLATSSNNVSISLIKTFDGSPMNLPSRSLRDFSMATSI